MESNQRVFLHIFFYFIKWFVHFCLKSNSKNFEPSCFIPFVRSHSFSQPQWHFTMKANPYNAFILLKLFTFVKLLYSTFPLSHTFNKFYCEPNLFTLDEHVRTKCDFPKFERCARHFVCHSKVYKTINKATVL